RIRRHLRIDKATKLPRPHVKDLVVTEFAPCRLKDHYHNTLEDDLMYMTYVHEKLPRPAPREIRHIYDPANPYVKYRNNPIVGGMTHMLKRLPPPSAPNNTVKLEKIVLHCFVRQAIHSKSVLLGPMMMLRALTGSNEFAGGRRTMAGVQIVRGRKSVPGWIRRNAPCGVKVEIKGPAMYDFIATLVEFVLPRIRDFSGLPLPPSSMSMLTPSGTSGVIAFGLPSSAMAYFPQLETNLDQYPLLPGMHIHFVTDARRQGAQNRARALLSGFQIPFTR
ncbi:ribosomal protein L5, partial [Fistulina hepatica ATCC 64428]